MKASEWRFSYEAHPKGLDWQLIELLIADFESLEVENAKWKESSGNYQSAMHDLMKDVTQLTASLAQANAQIAEMQSAIIEYLEWGPMSGSDRDYHQQNFRRLLPDHAILTHDALVGKVSQEVLGECPLNDEEARRLASRILEAIVGGTP